MSRAHAKLSPSSAHRWTRCSGSVEWEKQFPPKFSADATDGTITHAVAEHCLLKGIWKAHSIVGHPFSTEADGRSHNIVIEPDRADRVQVYLDHVASLMMSQDYISHAVEQRVQFGGAIGVEGQFGSCDFLALIGTTLHVVDYKDGRGVIVHPDGNEQLILYGCGALAALPAGTKVTDICLTIVQPKVSSHPVSHTYTLGEFSQQVTRIREAAQNVTPDAPRVAGEKQCRFCRGRATCPESLARAQQEAAQLFEGNTLPSTTTAAAPVDVHSLPSERITALLQAEAFIRQTLDAIAEEAVQRIRRGEVVEGFKLVAGRSSRKWRDDVIVSDIAKAANVSDDLLYEKKLRTVADFEKELPKKERDCLAPFISKSTGEPTLARVSDKRPAVEFNAQQLFASVDPDKSNPAAISFM